MAFLLLSRSRTSGSLIQSDSTFSLPQTQRKGLAIPNHNVSIIMSFGGSQPSLRLEKAAVFEPEEEVGRVEREVSAAESRRERRDVKLRERYLERYATEERTRYLMSFSRHTFALGWGKKETMAVWE